MHRAEHPNAHLINESDRKLKRAATAAMCGALAISLAPQVQKGLEAASESAQQLSDILQQVVANPLHGVSDINYNPVRSTLQRRSPEPQAPRLPVVSVPRNPNTPVFVYTEPPSVSERLSATEQLFHDAIANHQKVAWSYEADLCLTGNTVPRFWRTEISITDDVSTFYVRPVSYFESDGEVYVCAAERGVFINDYKNTYDPHLPRAIVLAHVSLIDQRVVGFTPCDEYLATTGNEKIDQERLANISTLACGA